MLLSDFDECNLVDNNCSKGGANCTNIVGSFKCTCQTRYFWNGMKCEDLFTVILFRLMIAEKRKKYYSCTPFGKKRKSQGTKFAGNRRPPNCVLSLLGKEM